MSRSEYLHDCIVFPVVTHLNGAARRDVSGFAVRCGAWHRTAAARLGTAGHGMAARAHATAASFLCRFHFFAHAATAKEMSAEREMHVTAENEMR